MKPNNNTTVTRLESDTPLRESANPADQVRLAFRAAIAEAIGPLLAVAGAIVPKDRVMAIVTEELVGLATVPLANGPVLIDTVIHTPDTHGGFKIKTRVYLEVLEYIKPATPAPSDSATQ